jgi:hypothetical protein
VTLCRLLFAPQNIINSILLSLSTLMLFSWPLLERPTTTTFYTKRMFIAAFKRPPQLTSILSQINTVNTTPPYLSKILLNITTHRRLGLTSCIFPRAISAITYTWGIMRHVVNITRIKNTYFWVIKIQFVPHRRPITSPLQIPAS